MKPYALKALRKDWNATDNVARTREVRSSVSRRRNCTREKKAARAALKRDLRARAQEWR